MSGNEAAAATALRVESLLVGPAFRDACAIIEKVLKGPKGYVKPTSWSLQGADTLQSVPEMPGSADALLSEREFIDPHLHAACRLDHPLASSMRRARPDLFSAVKWVVDSHGHMVVPMRRAETTAALDAAQKLLRPIDEGLRNLMAPAASRLLKPGASVALVAACARVMEWPDKNLVADMVTGFQAVGSYPSSGLFRDRPTPATRKFCSLEYAANNRKVIKRATAHGKDKAKQWQLSEITRKTELEVTKGLADRADTLSEVDTALRRLNPHHVDGCFQLLSTFGVEQGFDDQGRPKVRRCDNCKLSLTNECLGTEETISCEEASFPALAAALYSDALKASGVPLEKCNLRIATDDVESAYRRLPCRNADASVVAIWHTELDRVVFYTMPGHNFGLASAVLSFNRYTQFATACMRRLYGSPCAAYFDDYCMVEPVWCRNSAKVALRRVHLMLGMPLAEGAKDIPFLWANAFLGVISDLTRFHTDGIVTMRSKPERVAKIVVALQDARAADLLPPWQRKSLAGKLVYTTGSTGYSRVGRAAIRLLYQNRLHDMSDEISPALAEAMDFFIALLPLLPPRVICLRDRVRRPIVIYTDAMYEETSSPPGMIGIVIYDPEAPEAPAGLSHSVAASDDAPDWRWRHSSAAVSRELLKAFAERKQYITQLEMLAGVLAYSSRPAQLRGRDVIHFVDNSGALSILTKGYSREADCGRMTHFFHAIAASLQVRVWFEYVASGANIADLPSRNEFTKLRELGSIAFQTVWPDLGASYTASFAHAFTQYAPTDSRPAKSLRCAIRDAIALIRSRRAP